MMRRLISYLVFLFCVFNICESAAVFLELEEEPVVAAEPVNPQLPQPVMLREMLLDEDTSFLSRLIALGKYFDARYPDSAIEADFSADIHTLFPELQAQEVYDRTNLIRRTVKLYRFLGQYVLEREEEILAPEPPPLHIEAEDLIDEDSPYFDAGEGKFAIRTDFKKVLTYGNNPRDRRAIEAYTQRVIDQKKQKTNFEKFKSMVTKLEFSKIPFYGISEPNPFVGNAGIGEWVEKDGTRVRLISELAQISDEPSLMAALHFDVPAYRFIWAIGEQKPQVEMNIDPNAEVFYPRPIAVVDERNIGAYAGNFAMPVRISLEGVSEDLHLNARVRLSSCDFRLECQSFELTPSLDVEHAPTSSYSGVQNFIRQAYLNVPQEKNKYLRLVSVQPELADEGDGVARILFTFEHDTAGRNFSLFLEDAAQTEFSLPDITMTEDHIYASVKVLKQPENLIGKTLTLTAALNPYTQLRQSFVLEDAPEKESALDESLSSLMKLSFWAGVLFTFSLAGFSLLSFATHSKPQKTFLLFAAAGVFLGVHVWALVLYLISQRTLLYWGGLYSSLPYLLSALLAVQVLQFLLRRPKSLFPNNPRFLAFGSAVLIIFLAPLSLSYALPEAVGSAFRMGGGAYFAVAEAFALGFLLPYLLIPFSKINSKATEFIRLTAQTLLYFLTAFIFILILMILKFSQILLFLMLWAIGVAVLKYGFSFYNALVRTRLSARVKKMTFMSLLGALFFVCILIITSTFFLKLPSVSQELPSQEQINQDILNGKTVLVAIEADWCLPCFFNRLTVLDKARLQQWAKEYQLQYYAVRADKPDAQVLDYMHQFGRFSAPLYVLYNYNINNGYALGRLLNVSGLEQILYQLSL